jgi:hypothetical protein
MNKFELPSKPTSSQLSYVIVHILNLKLELLMTSFEVSTPNTINSTLLQISMSILFWTTTNEQVDLVNHSVIKPLLSKQLTIVGKLLHIVWNNVYGILIKSTKVVNWFLQPIIIFSHLCIFVTLQRMTRHCS